MTRKKWTLHILLFVLTLASTYFVAGFWFAFSLMSILLCHEMGHFWVSRYYGVEATLPFFIPFPLSPFGTFGAVIRMRGFIPNRRALFDIGAAGPIAGLVLTFPAIYVGLKLSSMVPLNAFQGHGMILGDSLLFKGLEYLALGPVPEGYDVALHPVAYAGWVGLFVTALNLLPIGQLDGGHILYALFGPKSRKIYRAAILLFAVYAVLYNPEWVLLVVLLFFFGLKHPPPLDDITPLDTGRRLVGIIMIVIFFLSFMPSPFPELTKGMGVFG
jgi:membrane-associated protease RseP (regulator of RpoE activity)